MDNLRIQQKMLQKRFLNYLELCVDVTKLLSKENKAIHLQKIKQANMHHLNQ